MDNARDLLTLWQDRVMYYGEDHALMDGMVDVYNGNLPPQFSSYFHEDMNVHTINMIRLSWDDMASMAGKVFPIYVDPDNDKPTAQKRAERQEKIGYGYNRGGRIAGGVSMSLLKKVISWWLVGTANACYLVLPSYDKKTPFFTFRDPRTCFPPIGWSAYTQAAPEDCIFAYEMSLGELKARYKDHASDIEKTLQKYIIGHGGVSKADDRWNISVGEYYHKDQWFVATLTDDPVVLSQSQTGDRGHPGVMPAVPIGLYSAQDAKGRSIFADQVSIQAGMARMFSQKLDYYDRTLYPLIFHTKLAGNTVRLGPYAMNQYADTMGVPPRMDVVAPQRDVDADKTMAFAIGLSRMLNRNPEMMQGGGEANSAKAIEALKAGITSTIRDGMWPPMVEAEPRLYSLAAQMDVNIWGNMKKRARGKRKNNAFVVDYVPAVHLRGREDDFEVEPGLGLAGYQGTLEIIQLKGAELIPEQDAVEQGEWGRDARGMVQRLQADKVRKLEYAALAALAANGTLDPGALAEIRKRIEEGDDMYDAITRLQAEGRLMIQPPAGPAGPAGPGGPGAPAPGGAGAGPLPSMQALEAIRARRGR